MPPTLSFVRLLSAQYVVLQPPCSLKSAALMSNHSAEYPNGILDKETLKSFFAITEAADGTLSWTPGYERIPDNWYYPMPQEAPPPPSQKG